MIFLSPKLKARVELFEQMQRDANVAYLFLWIKVSYILLVSDNSHEREFPCHRSIFLFYVALIITLMNLVHETNKNVATNQKLGLENRGI